MLSAHSDAGQPVSSRAPVWGASAKSREGWFFIGGFKSCPRVGGIAACCLGCLAAPVSSRAPVWGASAKDYTYNGQQLFQVVPPCGGHRVSGWADSHDKSFKSCPRVGGIHLQGQGLRCGQFQVVPPCGGHPRLKQQAPVPPWFQVVPPCGGHLGGGNCFCGAAVVSSRAPVWGASGAIEGGPPQEQFQVVPPCGGHPSSAMDGATPFMFQVVPPCGGHQASSRRIWPLRQFQVVPPCGGHPL